MQNDVAPKETVGVETPIFRRSKWHVAYRHQNDSRPPLSRSTLSMWSVFVVFDCVSYNRQSMFVAISAVTPSPTAMLLTAVDGKVAVAAERFAALSPKRRLFTQHRYLHRLNQVECAASVAGHVVEICYCVDQQCQLLRLFGRLPPPIVETTRSSSLDPSFVILPPSVLGWTPSETPPETLFSRPSLARSVRRHTSRRHSRRLSVLRLECSPPFPSVCRG